MTEFLHVTRQALHKRVLTGTMLGLAGHGNDLVPRMALDLGAHAVRPAVAEIVKVFRDEMGQSDPFVTSSWATIDQPKLGMSPEESLATGKDPAEIGYQPDSLLRFADSPITQALLDLAADSFDIIWTSYEDGP